MTYYQFVIRINGQLPMTMKTRYRSYNRAMKRLEAYVKQGISGCMVIQSEKEKGYSLTEVKEF